MPATKIAKHDKYIKFDLMIFKSVKESIFQTNLYKNSIKKLSWYELILKIFKTIIKISIKNIILTKLPNEKYFTVSFVKFIDFISLTS